MHADAIQTETDPLPKPTLQHKIATETEWGEVEYK